MLQNLIRQGSVARFGAPTARHSSEVQETTASLFERDRWFLWTAPVFAIGIAIYFGMQAEPDGVAVAAAFVGICTLRATVNDHGILTILLSVGVVVAAGFAAAKTRTEHVRAPVLSGVLRNAEISGFIEQVEFRSNETRRLTIHLTALDKLEASRLPRRARVVVRRASVPLAAGDMVRLRANLAAPPPPALPRGYDFARAAYFQGLGAVGYALADPEILKTNAEMPLPLRLAVTLQRARRTIGARIEQALPGETGRMANALMTGERSGISEATNDLYRDAGIFHILSISGLHMAIMGGSVFIALRFIFAALPAIALRYPIKKWAAGAAAVATLAYLLISGGAHPTIRSFIMILIMFAAILLDRPALALRNVAIAGLIILALMPESLFNAGFQLSFAAVTALIAAYEVQRTRTRKRRRAGLTLPRSTGGWGWLVGAGWFLVGTIATTVIAGLATAPFAAFHFHTSQQYAVLTNMIAIPLSNLIVMPAALAAFIAMPFGLEAKPLALMGQGIDLMTRAARAVADLPGATMAVPAFPLAALQLMIAGALWLCIWRRR
ncbi:MAG: ComEC/Rec2 family competence protein, partial [Alphaproteobacteria bacterium]|nr:ComEC/Rec2 family competence protein [Alphaproteobacteria bacterium]